MLNIKKSLTKIVLTVVSLFLIGCELEPQPIEYDFQLYGESLSLDENGFYHFDLSDGIIYNGITSRTKLTANTNNPNNVISGGIKCNLTNKGNKKISKI